MLTDNQLSARTHTAFAVSYLDRASALYTWGVKEGGDGSIALARQSIAEAARLMGFTVVDLPASVPAGSSLQAELIAAMGGKA